LNWITLKSIASAKIVASTAVWVFLVPAIVKITNLLNDTITGQSNIGLEFAPFSIVLLYFSALSFFLGSICYHIFCPNIIKITDSFSSFVNEGMDSHNLSMSLRALNKKSTVELINNLRQNADEASMDDINNNNYFTIISAHNNSINLKLNQLSSVFWIVYEFISTRKNFGRHLTSIFFLLGIILLSIIFIRNIEVVAIYTQNTFFS
jgi:hypothetical protein